MAFDWTAFSCLDVRLRSRILSWLDARSLMHLSRTSLSFRGLARSVVLHDPTVYLGHLVPGDSAPAQWPHLRVIYAPDPMRPLQRLAHWGAALDTGYPLSDSFDGLPDGVRRGLVEHLDAQRANLEQRASGRWTPIHGVQDVALAPILAGADVVICSCCSAGPHQVCMLHPSQMRNRHVLRVRCTWAGHVLDMRRTCVGHVWNMRWTVVGHAWACWTCGWICAGHMSHMCCTRTGHALDMRWICVRHALDTRWMCA